MTGLTQTSYVVLGVIALRGATTSYQLKRYVEGSIDYFWPVPHAQLYREPKRLADRGLLAMRQESAGRRRQFFELTDAGRAALQAWLSEPAPARVELRDAGLAKLHFAALMEPGALAALAHAQLAAREARLARFNESRERYGDGQDLLTLDMGIALERAAVAFWRTLADATPRTTPAPR